MIAVRRSQTAVTHEDFLDAVLEVKARHAKEKAYFV